MDGVWSLRHRARHRFGGSHPSPRGTFGRYRDRDEARLIVTGWLVAPVLVLAVLGSFLPALGWDGRLAAERRGFLLGALVGIPVRQRGI